MTYCFRCRTCGFTTESTYLRVPDVPCPECSNETLVRDYKAESVNIEKSSLR